MCCDSGRTYVVNHLSFPKHCPEIPMASCLRRVLQPRGSNLPEQRREYSSKQVVVTCALQRELDEVRTQLAAAEREHAAAAKEAEEASTARQAVTAKTDQLTKQRDDVMVVRLAEHAAAGCY